MHIHVHKLKTVCLHFCIWLSVYSYECVSLCFVKSIFSSVSLNNIKPVNLAHQQNAFGKWGFIIFTNALGVIFIAIYLSILKSPFNYFVLFFLCLYLQLSLSATQLKVEAVLIAAGIVVSVFLPSSFITSFLLFFFSYLALILVTMLANSLQVLRPCHIYGWWLWFQSSQFIIIAILLIILIVIIIIFPSMVLLLPSLLPYHLKNLSCINCHHLNIKYI